MQTRPCGLHKRMMVLVLAFVVLSSSAFATIDTFFIEGLWGEELVGGGGSGYIDPQTGSPWILYNQVPSVAEGLEGPIAASAPPVQWWNQWYYDHPPTWERWKEIWLDFDFLPVDPAEPITLYVTLNWSTMCYPPTGPGGAPPMPWEEEFIQRPGPIMIETEQDPSSGVWELNVAPYVDPLGNPYQWAVVMDTSDQHGHVNWWYKIPDFNPEWVSVDVWGYNVGIVNGEIRHECLIPEPLTISLLGLGVAGLCVARKRKYI